MNEQITSHESRRAELRKWLLANGRELSEDTLLDTTPLLERRHITSLQVPDLLFLIERLRRAPIELSELMPGDLRDLATIEARFFQSSQS